MAQEEAGNNRYNHLYPIARRDSQFNGYMTILRQVLQAKRCRNMPVLVQTIELVRRVRTACSHSAYKLLQMLLHEDVKRKIDVLFRALG